VFVTNYDNLVWLQSHYADAKRPWPFKRVIADESTRLKSFRLRQGGARAQALGKVAHTQVSHWINLTGTPSPNGLDDLWGQQWFIDAGQRLGRTYNSFQSRWFRPTKQGQFTSWSPADHAAAEIQDRLADCTLAIDPRDWFDLDAPIVNVIEVTLPPTVRRQYEELEKKFFSEIDGHDVEIFNAAAKTMKLLQMANGAVYVDPDGSPDRLTLEAHDGKLDALGSIVEEAGGAPVLVAYHFQSDLARLQRAFPTGRALGSEPGTIREWNEGRIPILFAHPASAGHGLNLQDGGNIVVFFGHWWDLEQHDQMIERIGPVRQKQAGHDRPVFIHYIVAKDTIDEVVMARRDGKRTVQEALMDYMKGKR